MSMEENKEPAVPTRQGDVGLLRDPVARQLLQSKSPAHLAYTWRDGTPRVVPIGFHWNGQEIVLATATDAPKTKVLKKGSKVAVSIDRDAFPPRSSSFGFLSLIAVLLYGLVLMWYDDTVVYLLEYIS